MNRVGFFLLLLLVTPSLPGVAHAQQPAPTPAPEPEGTVSPGGAFLRSMIVPGWGHVATESYARGGFYSVAQTGSLWMLWQTLDRRSEAAAYERLERDLAAARFEAAGMSDPDSILAAVDSDPAVRDRAALVDSRGQQVEDWSALSIFLVLLGATDAFVAAHLADYPAPLTLRVLPVGNDRAELRISIPVGGFPLGGSGRR